MKKRTLCALLLCLLLVGCANAPATEPSLGTFLPPTTAGGHDHPHPHPTKPNGGATPPAATQAPTEPSLGPADFILYLPNETADGFVQSRTSMNTLHHEGVLLLLKVKSVVKEGVEVNSCTINGTQLHLDLNQAFLDQLIALDSSGEKMLIGSIVNTFLSAYDCETVLLTVNGEAFDSSHATYDFPLHFFE